MKGHSQGRRESLAPLLWLTSVSLFGAAPAETNRDPDPGKVNRTIRADVNWARAVALKKLEDPKCRLIFSDFADSEGNTLQRNLESRGETANTFSGGFSTCVPSNTRQLILDFSDPEPPCTCALSSALVCGANAIPDAKFLAEGAFKANTTASGVSIDFNLDAAFPNASYRFSLALEQALSVAVGITNDERILTAAAGAVAEPYENVKVGKRTTKEDRSVSVLGKRDPRMVRAVSAAVAEARRKLSRPACHQIFSEFADGSGRTLAQNLEAAGQTGHTYLHWLVFRNGLDELFCQRSSVALAADPGSRFVSVCSRFLDLQRSDPSYAAILVIHEELHALGLGENPPSSAQITQRVAERCRR